MHITSTADLMEGLGGGFIRSSLLTEIQWRIDNLGEPERADATRRLTSIVKGSDIHGVHELPDDFRESLGLIWEDAGKLKKTNPVKVADMKRRTLPVQKAKEIVKENPELLAAVERVLEAGWDVLTLEAEETETGWDITAKAPSGVMVALMVPDFVARNMAVPGGESEDDLHITLAYLGEASALSLDDQRKLLGVIGEVTLRHQAMTGALQGTGRFVNGEDEDPYWVGVKVPGLEDLQRDIAAALDGAGLQVPSNDAALPYTPHVTVAYIPAGSETPAMNFRMDEVRFDEVTVAVGPQRFTLKLQGDNDMSTGYEPQGWAPEAINKAVEVEEESRYTLAPWYVPDFLDAHGEWSDVKELQKALWGYVDKGNRDIRLQHDTSIEAGRMVEAVTWPEAFTTKLTKASGETTEHTFPAGTPYLGVIWEPWAWDLIKAGKLTGYSIGGKTDFMEVDLGEGDVEAAPGA